MYKEKLYYTCHEIILHSFSFTEKSLIAGVLLWALLLFSNSFSIEHSVCAASTFMTIIFVKNDKSYTERLDVNYAVAYYHWIYFFDYKKKMPVKV